MDAIYSEFIMQVRTCCKTGFANITNYVALFDAGANLLIAVVFGKVSI